MDIDKDEIERSIAHQRKILRTLRSRLEQRELQEAQQGINTEPHIITEINDLTERIQRHEDEIARLKTLAAEDKEPIAEVEYRALLAEAWDTLQGRPTVASIVRLELARVRLGIALQRAQELEHEIRVDLAAEAVANVDARYLPGLRSAEDQPLSRTIDIEVVRSREAREATVRLIERAIRLDVDTAVQLFIERLDNAISIYSLIIPGQIRGTLRAATAWGNTDERRKINQFIDIVEAMLEARYKTATAQDPVSPSRPRKA